MPRLKDKGITLLGTSAAIDMKTAASTTIFTTDANRTTRITHVVVRDASATLAGGTSYSITNFRQAFSLTTMTAGAAIYRVIQATDNTDYTETAGNVAIQLTVTTGSTGSATAIIDVFGYTTT